MMEQEQLKQLGALNEQLLALQAAGVPFDIGFGRPASDLAQQLEKALASVTRRFAAGETWDTIWTAPDPALPDAYRAIARIGMSSGDWSRALDGVERLARNGVENHRWLRQGLLYPFLICLLAFVGVVSATLFVTPVVSDLYDALRIEPRWAMFVARWLQQSWPVWATGVPAVLLLSVLLVRGWERRLGRSSQERGWFGASRSMRDETVAAVAEGVAFQLSRGIGCAEALEVACRLSGDNAWLLGATQIAAAWRRGDAVLPDNPLATVFPPYLRWALLTPAEAAAQSESLRTVAAFYRAESERCRWTFQQRLQWIALVVLGGGATLIYALLLLAPVLQLLVQLV